MFPTRTCPRCGNHVWGTMDRCPIDGTPLSDGATAPGPRPTNRVSPEAQRSSPPRLEMPKVAPPPVVAPPPKVAPAPVIAPPPKATPAPKVAPPAKLRRATDLTVDIPDERPADKGRRSDDLSVFDSLSRPGSGADGRSNALDEMGPPRNRAGRSGRVALFLILAILGAGLGAWVLLRPTAKAPAPPIIAPVAAPAPPPPAAPVPAPVAAPPTQAAPAVPAKPSPPTPPPAPAKTTTSAPVTAPAKTARKSAARPRGKSAAPRPSSRLYGVPVPAEFMPKTTAP